MKTRLQRTGIVVQARMGSTRLPGKVMMDIGGKTALERVIERAKLIDGIDKIIVATNHDPEIARLASSIPEVEDFSFLGNENDVVARYHSAAEFFGLDIVVRITADCPLLDPEIGTRVVQSFFRGGYEYFSNVHPPTYPDGLDVEVFTFDALCKAMAHAQGREREHVTPYIWKRPYKFRMGNLMHPVNLSKHRWTLDTPEDLDFIRDVYKVLGDKPFGMKEVLALPFTHTATRTLIL